MKDILINILNQFCPDNVFLQGTLNEDEKYPETFITFFTNGVDDWLHFDNANTGFVWTVSVILYSSDPLKVNTMPLNIRKALKQAGFIPQGLGNDIMSDEPTHTGWAMDFIYIEKGDNTNE